MKPVRIMLVSQHALVRAGLRSLLESAADLHVVAETNRQCEAEFLIKRFQPEVVLVDVDGDSYHLLELVRAVRQGSQNLHVVLFGMSVGEDALLEALAAGASGYLMKEMSPAAFISAVRGVRHGEAALSRAMTMKVISALWKRTYLSAPAIEDARMRALSPRERQVLTLITEGVPNREIAVRLVVSEHTVKNHVKAVLAKLQVRSRSAAAAMARLSGASATSVLSRPGFGSAALVSVPAQSSAAAL